MKNYLLVLTGTSSVFCFIVGLCASIQMLHPGPFFAGLVTGIVLGVSCITLYDSH